MDHLKNTLQHIDEQDENIKIAVIILTYNHVEFVAKTMDRIPDDVWKKITEVVLLDDASHDDTYLVVKGYIHDRKNRDSSKITIIKNPDNLGYGGNQKKGYLYCINKKYDIAVLLHGDGQYAPEVMWDLIGPVLTKKADAVFGSRMMVKGAALRGGMPRYKYYGNKILTYIENELLGSSLTEFHSGYRVYNLNALKKIPFTKNTNDFHFDTEIIIQLKEKGFQITETPIPTYYGDEICHVNGLKYAWNVVKTVLQYRCWAIGFRIDERFVAGEGEQIYNKKNNRYSSHGILSRRCPMGRVLDIGCDEGQIGNNLIDKGCEITGVGLQEKGPKNYLKYYCHNLNNGLPNNLDFKQFDILLLIDVLEHLVEPEKLVHEIYNKISIGTTVFISVPNVANWYVRIALLFGQFPYARKGILDNSHLRFFTKK